MSSEVTKMAVRIKLEVNTVKDALPVLDHLDVNYDYDEDQDYIWKIDDEHWAIRSDRDDIYLDYVIAKSSDDEPYIDGTLSVGELNDIISFVPIEFQPHLNNVKVVAYTYYSGTDEPLVF